MLPWFIQVQTDKYESDWYLIVNQSQQFLVEATQM